MENEKTTPLYIKIGKLLLKDTSVYHANDLAQQPQIGYGHYDKTLYTVCLLDFDAPYPTDSYKSPILHWLVINVPGEQLERGNTIVPYKGPSPPKDSDPHYYSFMVFEQQDVIDMEKPDRENFDLEAFIEIYHLEMVAELDFWAGFTDIESFQDPPRKSLSGKRYFKKRLPVATQKYCRCLLHVAAKNPANCTKDKYGQDGCYSPYAVCKTSTGTKQNLACTKAYNLEELSDLELKGLARMEKVKVPRPYDRDALIERLDKWINSK